jgi:glycine cleavage system aminomethyltransferase T
LFTNNSGGWRAARDLAAAGVEVATVVDSRRGVGERLAAALEGSGVRHHGGAMLRRVRGRLGVESVEIESGGVVERIHCDLLCVSGGWNPDVQLHSQTGARPRWDAGLAAFVPGASRQREVSVGGAAGAFDIGAALRQGAEAGAAAATDCGYRPSTVELPAVDAGEQYRVEPLWRVPGTRGKALVDLQNDVTVSDINLAAREGFRSVEHLKRYTTLGMATDQGKLSNVNGLAILAAALDRPIESLGTTTFRPPASPVSLGVLAGSARGRRFAPTRRTPLHRWAERHDAVFVEAGQWLRPHYYPRPGEDLFAASVREARAVRESVGICDVSTLGKIDLQGSDAGEFLDRLYCNNIRSLPVGRARYGLMLREDGLVLDDGTVSRLGEFRYFVTTTTAEAAAVMAHMEFCHQALWPDLDVRYASVTEQWAAMAVAGPESRRVLEKVLDGFDLCNDAVPFMAATELPLGGFTARLFRISFSGELAYELCVPAGYGESVWQALVEAGAGNGITPYGTEALGILRIEKGHVAAAEINGQTTAADLGLGRMMSTGKDYVGRVLAGREALLEADREQLVGLRCLSGDTRLYAGAHLLAHGADPVAANDLGHVTSVTYSPALDSWIALALLRGGRERHGETLRAVSPLHRHDVEVEVVSPHFYDPENERLHG